MPASEAPTLNLQKQSRWGPAIKSIEHSTVLSASTSLVQNSKNTPQWPIEAQERPDLAVQFDRFTEVIYKTGTEATSPRELLDSLKQSPIFAAMVNPIGTKDTSRAGVIGTITGITEGLALVSYPRVDAMTLLHTQNTSNDRRMQTTQPTFFLHHHQLRSFKKQRRTRRLPLRLLLLQT